MGGGNQECWFGEGAVGFISLPEFRGEDQLGLEM